MTTDGGRRSFLQGAAAAAAGVVGAAASSASGQTPDPEACVVPPNERERRDGSEDFEGFSRYEPRVGAPPDSDYYLGKLVPGLRAPGLPPVPVEGPDLVKMPWTMVDGVKEFHITCEHVRRELLPGRWMDFFGYNGGMPGPTIEATQGDRVRFVVHNKLPEATSIHWHGLELPNEEDGVPGVTQMPIKPGERYVYEFDLHQTGTYFYHSHMPMQEAIGMVGFFIIHPRVDWDPPVDRDFLLLFQNFHIGPNQTVPDTMAMDWNWHTINGRSGPYTTPMVVRHGERVRVRLLDFSPQQHHPVHFHGHTFWVTAHEGARVPRSAWIPRNNELVAVAQASEFEFIANNTGDWLLHCHMVHHMMNHMVRQVGPRIREGVDVTRFRGDLGSRPPVKFPHTDPGYRMPGYPQMMQGMEMAEPEMMRINDRRETRGMREGWHMGVKGLMTLIRVLPDDLYDFVMHGDEEVAPGYVFEEMKRRRDERRSAGRA